MERCRYFYSDGRRFLYGKSLVSLSDIGYV